MRHAAIIEYDGSQYNGWQRQPHAPSVQATVETALSEIAVEPIKVHCAGRTDTGVHAVGQVIHFDTEKQRPNHGWLRGVNTRLPSGVAMNWINQVSDDFHARFSAQSRRYRYVLNIRKTRPALHAHNLSWYPLDLDINKLQIAVQSLIGKHDFSAYRASSCQSHLPVRTMYSIDIQQKGDWIWLDLHGDGFLHHMVRNIVGVLLKIGCGEKPTSWAVEVLLSVDRTKGGVTAHPEGLYFVQAQYAEKFGIPNDIQAPKFW